MVDDVASAASRDETAGRAVTAFFDDRAVAQTAIDDLVANGIARDRITLVEGGAEPVAHDGVASRDKSLWDTVKDLFMADEDRHAYGEGLRRGGFLLSVATGAADHGRVVELLDRDGAVDIDERQGDWELEGWNPARAASDLGAAATFAAPDAGAPDGAPAAPPAADRAGETVVRDTAAGGSRLRSYVTSRPDAGRPTG